MLLGDGVDAVLDDGFHVFIISESFEAVSLVVGSSPLEAGYCLEDDDSNTAILERITVNEDLLDVLGQGVFVLELLRGDVLTLGKLKDVLDTVDDLDRTVRVDHTDIAREEPALIVKGFSSLIFEFVVPLS